LFGSFRDIKEAHGNVRLTLACAIGQRVVAFGEACINTRCANVLPNINAGTARSVRSLAKGSAVCARQRHRTVDGKRSAFTSGLPSETSALLGRTISGATWKRRALKLAVQTVIPESTESNARCQSLMGNTPAPQRRRNPSCLVRRRFHAAGGRASRQLPG